MRLAVLIDADNASPAAIGDILSEVVSLGVPSVKRIYGDFTSQKLARWRPVLAEHAIQPIQQFHNTRGKSATDSALIIDAMDLLYTRELDGFCFVSSDGDFTRLATRIRENGLFVFGFGEEKSPKSLIQACDRFFHTENRRLSGQPKKEGGSEVVSPPLRHLMDTAFGQAFEFAAKGTERANLSEVGIQLRRVVTDFALRNYGCSKLKDLVARLPDWKLVPVGKSLHVERSPKPAIQTKALK